MNPYLPKPASKTMDASSKYLSETNPDIHCALKRIWVDDCRVSTIVQVAGYFPPLCDPITPHVVFTNGKDSEAVRLYVGAPGGKGYVLFEVPVRDADEKDVSLRQLESFSENIGCILRRIPHPMWDDLTEAERTKVLFVVIGAIQAGSTGTSTYWQADMRVLGDVMSFEDFLDNKDSVEAPKTENSQTHGPALQDKLDELIDEFKTMVSTVASKQGLKTTGGPDACRSSGGPMPLANNTTSTKPEYKLPDWSNRSPIRTNHKPTPQTPLTPRDPWDTPSEDSSFTEYPVKVKEPMARKKLTNNWGSWGDPAPNQIKTDAKAKAKRKQGRASSWASSDSFGEEYDGPTNGVSAGDSFWAAASCGKKGRKAENDIASPKEGFKSAGCCPDA
ncbi:hypothetical protein QQZ08_007677 [Neonectria magnoliae]|uniref:Uncharacterized protein n=1 Tax=Neonectria magnoliae TaxID=2732573 RepID=A0ABR1HX29_9HYPO